MFKLFNYYRIFNPKYGSIILSNCFVIMIFIFNIVLKESYGPTNHRRRKGRP